MKLNFLFSLAPLLVVAMSLFSHSASAEGGAGTRGGGTVVVLSDGSVRLTDLIDSSLILELNSAARTKKILKILDLNPMSKMARAQLEKDFFLCADPRLGALVSAPETAIALRTLNRSFKPSFLSQASEFTPEQMLSRINLGAEFSTRVPDENQLIVAAFSEDSLFVDERLYTQLDFDSRCALGVHERLRMINAYSHLRYPLSTAEIELLTRTAMKLPVPELEPLKSAMTRLQIALRELASGGPTLSALAENIDEIILVARQTHSVSEPLLNELALKMALIYPVATQLYLTRDREATKLSCEFFGDLGDHLQLILDSAQVWYPQTDYLAKLMSALIFKCAPLPLTLESGADLSKFEAAKQLYLRKSRAVQP